MWNFHNLSLALLQRRVVEFASPRDVEVQPGVSALEYIVKPNTLELISLCNSIKIRATAYSSFSILGLALTLAIGSLIILLNLRLSIIAVRVQEKSGRGLYQRLEWEDSSVFQLQRIGLEGCGIGPWQTRHGVPSTTERGQKFSLVGLKKRALLAGDVQEGLLRTGDKQSVEPMEDESLDTGEDGSFENSVASTAIDPASCFTISRKPVG